MKSGLGLGLLGLLGLLANATGCWRTVAKAVTADRSTDGDAAMTDSAPADRGTDGDAAMTDSAPADQGADGNPADSGRDSTASNDLECVLCTLDADGDGATVARDGEAASYADGGDGICPMLTIAVVGTPGVWGDRSDLAFQDWLNSNNANSAKVDNYPQKPAFTADFLAGYSLIVLAGLGDNSNTGPWWTFGASEVAAFQDWIENKGGGVISLSGYSNDDNEIAAKNALLAFSGISYKQECMSPPCQLFDGAGNKMCYQCGNPYQLTEWNRSDPVIANLSLGVTMIGIDGGRPILAPADAHVGATTTDAVGVDNWLVGKIIGKGRVLAFSDEWIAYTDQWSGRDGQYANDPACTGYLPARLYQTAQFWYNMIRWAQPNSPCFKIEDSQQPVTIW